MPPASVSRGTRAFISWWKGLGAQCLATPGIPIICLIPRPSPHSSFRGDNRTGVISVSCAHMLMAVLEIPGFQAGSPSLPQAVPPSSHQAQLCALQANLTDPPVPHRPACTSCHLCLPAIPGECMGVCALQAPGSPVGHQQPGVKSKDVCPVFWEPQLEEDIEMQSAGFFFPWQIA